MTNGEDGVRSHSSGRRAKACRQTAAERANGRPAAGRERPAADEHLSRDATARDPLQDDVRLHQRVAEPVAPALRTRLGVEDAVLHVLAGRREVRQVALDPGVLVGAGRQAIEGGADVGRTEEAEVVVAGQGAGEQHVRVVVALVAAGDGRGVGAPDRVLRLVEGPPDRLHDVRRVDTVEAGVDGDPRRVQRQQVRVVRQALGQRGDVRQRVGFDGHTEQVEAAHHDVLELVGRHPRHPHLDQRPLDRAVLLDQAVDRVGHADQDQGRRYRVVREHLDGVGECGPDLGVADAIELVHDDHEDAAAPDRPERALHVGGRDDLGHRLIERALLLAGLGAEADHGPFARHLDVGEDAPPQRRKVVGALAGDARRHHRPLLGSEPIRQDVGERRLADAGLAEDDDVDAGLADGVDDLLDLLEAAGEDRALADRDGRREDRREPGEARLGVGGPRRLFGAGDWRGDSALISRVPTPTGRRPRRGRSGCGHLRRGAPSGRDRRACRSRRCRCGLLPP